MDKAVGTVLTVIIFIVFVAVLKSWELNVSATIIFSALFTVVFGYLFFFSRNKKSRR